MKLLHKIVFAITGLAAGFLVYPLLILLLLQFREILGASFDETALTLVPVVILPLSFFLGSVLTGYLIQPRVVDRRGEPFIFSPGTWAAAMYIIPVLLHLPPLGWKRAAILFAAGVLPQVALFAVPSYFGCLWGMRLRDRSIKA